MIVVLRHQVLGWSVTQQKPCGYTDLITTAVNQTCSLAFYFSSCLVSNQSILKEINPEYPLEGLMQKLKLQYFGHPMRSIGKDPDAGKD